MHTCMLQYLRDRYIIHAHARADQHTQKYAEVNTYTHTPWTLRWHIHTILSYMHIHTVCPPVSWKHKTVHACTATHTHACKATHTHACKATHTPKTDMPRPLPLPWRTHTSSASPLLPKGMHISITKHTDAHSHEVPGCLCIKSQPYTPRSHSGQHVHKNIRNYLHPR